MKLQDNYPDGRVLWFNDFYLEDNRMFFSAGNFNGLYEYSLTDKKVSFLGKFKDEYSLSKQLYGNVYKFENQLIFTPMSANSIGIYDLDKKDFETIALPMPEDACGYECKFLNSVIYKNSFFAFPGYSAYIIEYDIKEKKLKIHKSWYNEFLRRFKKKSNLLFNFDFVQINDAVYLPSEQYTGIFKYCLSDNTYEFIEILGICEHIHTLSYDGEHIWCSTNNKLLILSLDGKLIEKIDILTTYGVEGDFYHSIYHEGYLLLFACQTSTVLRVDCINYKTKFKVIRYYKEEKKYTNYEYHAVNFVKKKSDKVTFMCRGDRTIQSIVDGNIEKYSDAIVDTTGYAERNVGVDEIYIEGNAYDEKREKYMHINDKNIAERNVFYERTLVHETMEFMLNIIEVPKIERQSFSVSSIGEKIYRSIYYRGELND